MNLVTILIRYSFSQVYILKSNKKSYFKSLLMLLNFKQFLLSASFPQNITMEPSQFKVGASDHSNSDTNRRGDVKTHHKPICTEHWHCPPYEQTFPPTSRPYGPTHTIKLNCVILSLPPLPISTATRVILCFPKLH